MSDPNSKTASLSAQNTFTTALSVGEGIRASISVSGVSDSTVTLQRRLDGTNWRDVESWSASVESSYVADQSCDIRLGIKTGDYGSDTVVCLVGVGESR